MYTVKFLFLLCSLQTHILNKNSHYSHMCFDSFINIFLMFVLMNVWIQTRQHNPSFISQYFLYDTSFSALQGCQPYPLEPCEHHVNGSLPDCSSLDYSTPKCESSCTNSAYDVAFNNDKHKGRVSEPYVVGRSICLPGISSLTRFIGVVVGVAFRDLNPK